MVVIAVSAWFVWARLRADLDDRVNASLRARSAAAVAAYDNDTPLADVALEDPEESFVQVIDRSGRVLAGGGEIHGPAIRPDEAQRLRGLGHERVLAGVDGRARLAITSLAGPTPGVIVVGQSLIDRDEALANLVHSFVIGGVASLLAASAAGYVLARAGLAPVEAMRRKVVTIAESGAPESVPVPAANDQIRRLGETLNEMLRRLGDALDRERRFVSDASHEIRTPLSALRLELESLLGERLEPDVRESVALAHAQALRLSALADDLLVLARLDDGRLPLRPVAVELEPLLRGVAATVEGVEGVHSGRISVACAPGMGLVVDPDRLRQIVGNLVTNAVRHGAGRVTVSAEPGRVSGTPGVLLSVTDQGAGFAPEFAPTAFERFTQADAARGTTGAGLGLPIVAAVARAHGGRAWLDEGQAATVRVWLPAT